MALPPIIAPTPIDAAGLERYQPAEPTAPVARPSFADALGGALSRASAEENAAEQASQRFAAGDPGMGIHEVMIAAEKASIAVRYAVTLKNKVLEAYRELMNTPL